MNKLPPINKLLKFKHSSLINRYAKDYPHNKISAEVALGELMKYLWLTLRHQKDRIANPQDKNLDFSCVMHKEMHEIDDMWHTFILHTREYEDFCNKYFGYFIHHIPKADENRTKDNEIHLERYLSYIYDKLGEKTLNLWFSNS